MMTLFEKIKDVVPMGFHIGLSNEGLHLKIDVTHKEQTKTQILPIHDHFTEDRVVGCISYLVNKFIDEHYQNNYNKKHE